MKRKIVSALLAIIVIFTNVSLPVFSEEETSQFNILDETQVEMPITSAKPVPTTDVANATSVPTPTEEVKDVTPVPTKEAENTTEPNKELSDDNAQIKNDDDIVLLAVTDLSEQLTAGPVTISESGSYSVSSVTTNNVINIVSGVTADLTIEDISITSTTTAPIKVESGAVLNLHIQGDNTLTPPKYFAGIAVYAEDITSDYGTLVIDGDGSLTITSSTHGPGIGTNKKGSTYDNSTGICGKIIINDGIINTTGGAGGAGIGMPYTSVQTTPCGEIEINGGKIIAKGGTNAAGIGGANAGANGKITINGGYIKASGGSTGIGPGKSAPGGSESEIIINGGSIDAVLKNTPVDKYGTELRQVVFIMPDTTSMANKEVNVGSWSAYTDENGKLYVYLEKDKTEFAVNYNKKIYYVGNITEDVNEYTLSEYGGDSCVCDEDNSSVTLDMPDNITVNQLVGQESVKLNCNFKPADNCTYPTHPITSNYEITIDGETADSSLAQIKEGNLIVYYAAAGKTLHLKANVAMNTNNYIVEKDITIIGDNKSRFDLSNDDISITANSTDDSLMDITVGSTKYTLSKTTEVYIYQTSQTTSNTISVKGVDARLIIDNVHIKTITQEPITIGDNVSLTIKLQGDNSIQATNTYAISGILATSSLTIEGDGTLTSTSGFGAGIGNVKNLTINGGTITANGGNGGAGIGGGQDGAGINVTINDGKVFAYGDGNAAGIGGGSSTSAGGGGNFVMNGGMVVAQSGGNGSGIGYGGRTAVPGTITINGGSVNADLAVVPKQNNKNQYKVTLGLEGVEGAVDVTYSIGDDNSNPIPTSTDSNGKLYLYLNAGEQWIRVYKDGQTYYRYMTVNAIGTNNEICVLNPEAKLTKFDISGQVGETVIDDEAGIVKITVPYNIKLDKIAPETEYKGAKTLPDKGSFIDFTGLSAKYTIISDDKQSKEYNVILTLTEEPSEPEASVYDISKGNVIINQDYVNYGGTYYNVNELGYIITGTTTENYIMLDYSEKKLPHIVLDNVNIEYTYASGCPITINANADITIKGKCSIKSLSTNAIEVKNAYTLSDGVKVSMTGDGFLSATGGVSHGAVSIGLTAELNVAGLASEFITGVGSNALIGEGKFITDSSAYTRISSTSTPEIQPTDKEGTPLYQLTAYIDAEDKSAVNCTYNDITYYVGENATLYIMVPDDTYNMVVTYDGIEYEGDVVINKTGAEVTLQAVVVNSVTYDNSPLTYKGGTVDFIVDGTMVAGRVKIRLVPDDTNLPFIEGTVTEVEGQTKASITIPENKSYERDITYTVYCIVKDKEEELQNKIVVLKNDTVCYINEFKIANQIGSENIYESDDYNSITINMPYDHVFKTYYTPAALSFYGRGISPEADTPVAYTLDSSERYVKAFYTVTARDNTTQKKYEVKIYKESTPSITSLSFQNPTSWEGGEVEVTARGTALINIQNAENLENRNVWIYSENGIDPVKAELKNENGIYTYVATINVPPNTSDTTVAQYPLKAKIGNTEQEIDTSLTTISVPRRERGLVGIQSFELTGQVGETEINDNKINIVMPYDANLTNVLPDIILEDSYASYSPVEEQNFNSDVVYTVTAENGTEKEYTVHVTKQEKPVATSIEFESPKYSSAGRVEVKINGNYLENAQYAMNLSKDILVEAKLISGDSANSQIDSVVAKVNEDGDYVATITVPQNNGSTPRKYELSVLIGDAIQTLSGNVTLTVPEKGGNTNELTDIILVEGQSAITISDNDVYLYVPYNTDLRSITPQIFHTGITCEPSPNEAQDFNNVVKYKIIAENGNYREYSIHTYRSGAAGVNNIEFTQPESFKDINLSVDINGNFIPYLTDDVKKDVLTISAISREDQSVITGKIKYDSNVYGGHATGELELPENYSDNDKIYDIKITVNGEEQDIGKSGIITVPRRKSRKITYFGVNGQIGSSQIIEDDVNGNSIIFRMPYSADLTALLPTIIADADSYTPTVPVDFSNSIENPVEYRVSATDDVDRIYKVIAQHDGIPSITSVTATNIPKTFRGGNINIDIEGVFYDSVKVWAISGDEKIEGTVTMDQSNKASAVISLPENDSVINDKEYTLKFDIDGFENISYSLSDKIVVPRRKTRAITNFIVPNQVGVTEIGESDIYFTMPYNIDISAITPMVTIDGDDYSPKGAQNFNNETNTIVYTVSAADDDDRMYTVHLQREGKPEISGMTFISPQTFKGGTVQVNFTGTFFNDAVVSAVPVDGGAEIQGKIISFDEGRASVSLEMPTNYDTENEKVYQLKFIIDGIVTSYSGDTEIIVPRRTTRAITEFTMPGIQEGETRIDGTSIYLDIPYHLDISSVTPQIIFDADSITPTTPQDFSDAKNPVKYTLSSLADTDVTYTVYVTRIGEDPYIESMIVDGQLGETEYKDDTINIVLPSKVSLNSIEPILRFVGSDYTPKGSQDFSRSKVDPVIYTVTNKYGIERKYAVTITNKPGITGNKPIFYPTAEPTVSPESTPTPEPTETPKNKPYINGYDENGVKLFKPDNTITRAEVAKILAFIDVDYDSDKQYDIKFKDVNSNSWYSNYVNYAADKNYVSGYEDGTYRPDNMITRAEFALMIARYIGVTSYNGVDKFKDIDEFEWCKEEINALAEKGIINGYENGLFMPESKITRAEAVAIINRATGRKIASEVLENMDCPFSDVATEHWAYCDIIAAACEY